MLDCVIRLFVYGSGASCPTPGILAPNRARQQARADVMNAILMANISATTRALLFFNH